MVGCLCVCTESVLWIFESSYERANARTLSAATHAPLSHSHSTSLSLCELLSPTICRWVGRLLRCWCALIATTTTARPTSWLVCMCVSAAKEEEDKQKKEAQAAAEIQIVSLLRSISLCLALLLCNWHGCCKQLPE